MSISTLPIRIPAVVVKYIATFLKHNGRPDVKMLMILYKSFTYNIYDDDQSNQYYIQNVHEYLSVIMYDAIDEWYALSGKPHPYELSPLDLYWVYELTFAEHLFQSELAETSILFQITSLLGYMMKSSDNITFNYINVNDMPLISLLEKALILKRGELIRFIYENILQAWHVFYLYAKHNHASYRTKTNSLANDKGLLDLLIHQGGYQKELLSLAITGLFENEFTYHNFSKISKTTTIKEYKIMPNPKVVKTILKSFPSICNEVIPYYMKPRIEVELDENYGEEGPDEILPLDMWKFYKNTFAERVYVDRSNDIYMDQIITIPKNELIGKLLEAAN